MHRPTPLGPTPVNFADPYSRPFCQTGGMDECVHLMEPATCALCDTTTGVGISRVGSYGFHGGETKQDVLNDITRMLRLPQQVVSVGSSLPSVVFVAAARRVDVRVGSMPEICEAIVRKAGHPYAATYDSRGSLSGGGSTVTLEGIQAMRSALRVLL